MVSSAEGSAAYRDAGNRTGVLMRVLVLTSYYSRAGGLNPLFSLLCRGWSAGVEHSLGLPRDGHVAQHARGLGVSVRSWEMDVGLARKPWRLPRFIGTAREIASHCRGNRVSLIHCNDHFVNPYGIAAGVLASIPVVSHVRGVLTGRQAYSCMLWASRQVVCISHATAASVDTCRLLRRHPVVIWDGVDLERFTHQPEVRERVRAHWGLGAVDTAIGFAGRICHQKRVYILVDAFARARTASPRLSLWIAGEPNRGSQASYMNTVRRRAADLGLSHCVHFLGHRDDMSAFYTGIDMLVCPFVGEGLGNVAIEAMASSRAVIAAESGGLAEVVVDGETGVLVTPDDVDALAEAILALARDEGLRRQMGVNGRARAAEHFSAEAYAQEVFSMYRHIADRRQPSLRKVGRSADGP